MPGLFDGIAGDDELGADDFLGDDMMGADDFLGAVRRGAISPTKARQAAALNKVANAVRTGAGMVANREQVLPLSQAGGGISVAGAATVNYLGYPQRPFRMERLVIGCAANSFSVAGITIGADPQFAGPGTIPADTFFSTAVGVRLKGATATPGVIVTLQVTNLTGGALNLTAGAIGPAVD